MRGEAPIPLSSAPTALPLLLQRVFEMALDFDRVAAQVARRFDAVVKRVILDFEGALVVAGQREPEDSHWGWDVFTLFADRRLPDEIRARAAQRLVAQFLRPIHSHRWRRARVALQSLAQEHGRSPEDELRLHVLAALPQAINGLPDEPGHPGIAQLGAFTRSPEKKRVLLRTVRRLVTESLLGAAPWRHEGREVRDLDLNAFAAPAGQIGAIEILNAIEAATLTGREEEVLLEAAQGCSSEEIARKLGIAASTARVLLGRARAKIRSA